MQCCLGPRLQKRILEGSSFKENVQHTAVDSKANLHIGDQILYLHPRPQLSQNQSKTPDFSFFFFLVPFFFLNLLLPPMHILSFRGSPSHSDALH